MADRTVRGEGSEGENQSSRRRQDQKPKTQNRYPPKKMKSPSPIANPNIKPETLTLYPNNPKPPNLPPPNPQTCTQTPHLNPSPAPGS